VAKESLNHVFSPEATSPRNIEGKHGMKPGKMQDGCEGPEDSKKLTKTNIWTDI
jgi:hypothetical protein